jgi:hypothetical protein
MSSRCPLAGAPHLASSVEPGRGVSLVVDVLGQVVFFA